MKPTAVRLAEGVRGHHRPINKHEPNPPAGAPDMPSHLDAIARKEWRRLVPVLLRMRVLTEADGNTLASLCMAHSTLVRAQREIAKQPAMLLESKNGHKYRSPLLAIVDRQIELINVLSQQFGLTPASRSKISTSKDAFDDVISDAMFNAKVERLA
jgi:P27 family predicted phage terminase small subunit